MVTNDTYSARNVAVWDQTARQGRAAGLRCQRNPLPDHHPATKLGSVKILVLGGTVFLSEAVAAEAVRRGHEVVCACRGSSGQVPDGARLVRWDRDADDPLPTDAGSPDAVVDVARQPSWVRTAVAALPEAHWVFVSTINVYADDATPGGRPGVTPLVAARHDDADLATEPEAYGPMKVACEQAVQEGAASSMVVRPGLICGPGDPTYRFGYWPERLAEGGEALAGGAPDDTVQVIDVRDLAAWIVTACEQRIAGTFDGVGPTMSIGDLLAQVAEGVDAEPTLTWAPGDVLTEHGVAPTPRATRSRGCVTTPRRRVRRSPGSVRPRCSPPSASSRAPKPHPPGRDPDVLPAGPSDAG
jgi:2'-hydroxyisoflavone reductase